MLLRSRHRRFAAPLDPAQLQNAGEGPCAAQAP
jgi:hypothetical protein